MKLLERLHRHRETTERPDEPVADPAPCPFHGAEHMDDRGRCYAQLPCTGTGKHVECGWRA